MSKKILIFLFRTYLNAICYIFPRHAAKMALNLFSSPRAGKHSKSNTTFLQTATQQPLIFNNLTIMSYLWPGREKTILLAHGWESNAARWELMITKLKETGYSIVAIDAPAHGKSEGKTFNGIIYADCLNVAINFFKPEILIGHSAGGMSALFALHRHNLPSVEKIVSLAAPARFKHLMYNYQKIMGYNDRVMETIDSRILEKFGVESSSFDTTVYATSLELSGLIIHDIYDEIIAFKESEDLSKSLKNSKFISTEGFGHSVNTPEVNQFVYNFVKA